MPSLEPTPTRRALVIYGSSDISRSYDHLATLQDYFCSSAGGQWNRDEFHILMHPNKVAMQKALDELNEVDYALIVYSGCAAELETHQILIKLSDANYTLDEFSTSSKRQTWLVEHLNHQPILGYGAARLPIIAQLEYKSRMVFDKFICDAPPGKVILSSLQPPEMGFNKLSAPSLISSMIEESIHWLFSENGIPVLDISLLSKIIQSKRPLKIDSPFEHLNIGAPFAIRQLKSARRIP